MKTTLLLLLAQIADAKKLGVVWLHGLGGTPYWWMDVWAQSGLSDKVEVAWRFPAAKIQLVTSDNQHIPSWFDVPTFPIVGLAETENDKEVQESVQTVHNLIDDLHYAEGVAFENIFVGGFSQGGALAMQSGFSFRKPIGGVINFAGWLLYEKRVEQLQAQNTTFKHRKEVPLLWWHGSQDTSVVFPIQDRVVKMLKEKVGVSSVTTKVGWNVGHTADFLTVHEAVWFIQGVTGLNLVASSGSRTSFPLWWSLWFLLYFA